MVQVARMPRLIQQGFSEERRLEERRGVGGREGCDGGRGKGRGEAGWLGGRKKERDAPSMLDACLLDACLMLDDLDARCMLQA